MQKQLALNVAVMAVTALVLAIEALYAWRRSRFSGRDFFALFLATNVAVALCAALLFLNLNEAWVLRWAALWGILGSTLAAAFFFLFAARFAGVRALCSRPTTAVLVCGTAALVVAVAVSPSLMYLSGHGLTATSFTAESVGPANGPLFWGQNVIFWILIASSAALLITEVLRGTRLHKAQARAAIIGVTITLSVQVLCMLGLVVLPGIHAGVIAVALGVPPILWALPRLRASDTRNASERRTLEAMSDAVFVLDESEALATVNAAARELISAGQGDASPTRGSDCSGWMASRIAAEAKSLDAESEGWSEGRIALEVAGEPRHFHLRQTSLCDSDGSRLSSVLVLRDVSTHVATETALRSSEQRLRILFDEATVGIIVFDSHLVALEVNERWAQMAGCEARDLLGATLTSKNISSLLGPCRAVLGGESGSYSGPLNTSGGERWLECKAAPLRDPSGQISGGLCLAWDVTENRRSEALIERLSFSDTITGMPNRALLRDQLRRILADNDLSGRGSVVAIVDIDGFGALNDALGLATADRLLKMVGDRLRLTLPDEDMIARWGADEFAVLRGSLEADDEAHTLCERLSACFAEPWDVDGRDVWLTASIGAALSPADGDEATQLLVRAESALRSAKSAGGDCSSFYSAGPGTTSGERLTLASDLHRALDEDQFEVYYQPQVEMADGTLVGCEALLRWRHPEHGLVRPDQFIPLAEESGLIVPIGEWVLRSACAQVASWTRQTGNRMRLCVNLSTRQLREDDLAEVVGAVLAESGLAPAQLELEVTETAILADPQAAARKLDEIAARGVSVALDDFGTGYSSLAHLCELSIDRLKIDRSFVGKLPDARDAAVVCRAVIDLANGLDVDVIAEGVETEDQVIFLRDSGCDEAQGYLFGRPTPAHEFEMRWLPARAAGASERVGSPAPR